MHHEASGCPPTPRFVCGKQGAVKRCTRAIGVVIVANLAHLMGCGAPAVAFRDRRDRRDGHDAPALLPDVRLAKDRPPVVLVAREGDPTGAIAVAVTTSGALGAEDDPEVAVALAGVIESRLTARGLAPIVAPSWSGLRAALLVASGAEADAATAALRDALNAPIEEKDLVAAKKKLTALAARPLRDGALARWARCVGSPHALPARAGKSGDDLDAARLEKWRAAAHGLGRVAFAVAAPSAMAESVAASIARLPAWKAGASADRRGSPSASSAAGIDVEVYEVASELPGASAAPVVHATLDVGTGSDAVTTAEALGDPHGPLASRLAALDLPFRLREVTAAAEPRGGCVGIVLEAGSPSMSASTSDVATRVADAIALVHVEAQVHLTEGGAGLDGRTLARRAGDAREAAERAAWWALADSSLDRVTNAGRGSPAQTPSPSTMRGSVALGLPLRRGSSPSAEGALDPSRDALSTAMQRAALSWQKPVAEGRVRLEPGQGETWVLLASPCGTEGETDADAGLTALFTVAAAEMAKSSPEARVEPWIVPDGAGLLVHGPALVGESPAAQARRLADVVARSFASDALALASLGRARAELLRHDARSDGPALGVIASAIAPGHASWFIASGREDTLARAADAAVVARAQSLRAGPLRVAVLANVDAAQGEAALRAADRWIDRRASDARACRGAQAATAPRPGTYAIDPRSGAAPEAYLAFPLAARDEGERTAATLVAAALDGDGGLLDKALAGPGLARAWSARVVGWPRAPALVVRVVSTQAALDGAVMQTRALLDRVKKGGLAAPDHERATGLAARAAIAAALDPRARVVATWRGEAIPSAAQPLPRGRASIDDVRAFAAKRLGEEALVVVASRPGRPPSTPPGDGAPRVKSP